METKGQNGEKNFTTGAIAVTDSTNWVSMLTVQANRLPVYLYGTVGSGGALGHLKVSVAADVGGTHKDLVVDTDFATPTSAFPTVLGTAIHTTAANGTFAVRLNAGVGEYTVWAKKASGNTTVTFEGSIG